MADKIYNFFNFLEKKAGEVLPPDKHFTMKLRHAKELVDEKDINALSLQMKILYYPERIKGDDLIVKGDYRTPFGTTALPEGFTVEGYLNVSNLEKIPVNLKATSVNWEVSSDLYPESFNGATFTKFAVGKNSTKLPIGIKVTNVLDIESSKIKQLPENLHTVSIDARNTPLTSLPSQLTCDQLDIIKTGIKEIPEGVVVNKKLSVTAIPLKFPKHIEDVIAINGYITIRQKKAYEALPEISVKVGRKVKKGKGMQVPLTELSEDKFTNTIDTFKEYTTADNYRIRINRLSSNAGKFFNTKFTTLYFFYTMKDFGFDVSWFIYGKDNKNREILLNPEVVMSTEGQVSLKSISLTEPTERQILSTLSKLFPKSYEGEKPVKAVNIRTLMNGPQSARKYWKIDRKTRGGFGIQGKAKDLVPSLSLASQDNMQHYAKRNNVTWGDMMVFDNNGAINIIARSNEKTQDGKYVYFDKHGYGQGGGSTIFIGSDYIKP